MGGNERGRSSPGWIVKPHSPPTSGSPSCLCAAVVRSALDVAAFGFFTVRGAEGSAREAAACLAKAVGEACEGPHLKAGLFGVRLYVGGEGGGLSKEEVERAWSEVSDVVAVVVGVKGLGEGVDLKASVASWDGRHGESEMWARKER